MFLTTLDIFFFRITRYYNSFLYELNFGWEFTMNILKHVFFEIFQKTFPKEFSSIFTEYTT